MVIHYKGTIQNLKKILQGTSGLWTLKRNGRYVFRTSGGGVLNWWPSTGNIQIQGQSNGRIFLENILSIYLNSPPSPVKAKNKLDGLKLVIQFDINAAAAAKQLELKLQRLGVENISLMQVISDFC